MTDLTDPRRKELRDAALVILDKPYDHSAAARELASFTLDTVEPPALPLSEELMDWSHKVFLYEGGKQTMRDYSALAKQMEHDLAEARAEVERLDAVAEDYARRATAALTERDEARAEVKRLDAEVERLDGEVPQETPWQFIDDIRALLGKAPLNPADVPPGEAWIVECRGERRTAVKDRDDNNEPWNTFNADGWYLSEDNEDITLIARLVPAPRTITNPDELDELAEGTIIRARDGEACRKSDGGDWSVDGLDGAVGYGPRQVLPVTVLWEPATT